MQETHYYRHNDELLRRIVPRAVRLVIVMVGTNNLANGAAAGAMADDAPGSGAPLPSDALAVRFLLKAIKVRRAVVVTVSGCWRDAPLRSLGRGDGS